MKASKIPKFNSYACVGDSVTWQVDGFNLTATLEFDQDSTPFDSDCYSPLKIKQWQNDEWLYVGVVISVSKNGIEIHDNAASLWGVDCNYNRRSNRYLSEVVRELEGEALEVARKKVERMLEALQ
jgi:hypothetical protein